MSPKEKEHELARLLAEVLREEAAKVPLPPTERIWERLQSRLGPAPPRRRYLWPRFLTAVGLAAALVLVVASLYLAGHSGRQPFQLSLEQQSPAPAAPAKSAAQSPPAAQGEARALFDAPVSKTSAADKAEQSAPAAPPPASGQPPVATSQAPSPDAGQGARVGEIREEKVAPPAQEGSAAEAKRREPAAMAWGRNGSQPLELPEEHVSWEEARVLAPFPLPELGSLPPSLALADITIRRLDRERAVVRVVYAGIDGTYLALRVGNVPLEAGSEVAAGGQTVRQIEVDGAPAQLEVQDGRTALRWRKENLYLDLETNLEITQAMEVARSLKWPK